MPDEVNPRGQLSIRIVAMPADTNGSGDIFGGWLVSHMDLAGMCESVRRAHCRTVTVAINSMVFLKPVSVGDIVCCYTDIIKTGRTSMEVNIECWTISLSHEERIKVAEGIFVYVAIDADGKPQPVDR
jgi:acyl-CoA thioesterase YciA